MIVPVNFANFDTKVRKIYIDKEKKMAAVTMGPGSYLVNGSLEYGDTNCHVLIGRYCSLAHRIIFEIGLNHDYHQVTSYPFINVMKNDDFNHYTNINHYQVIIGNDVWIGCDVIILGGSYIGNGAVIGAGSVVSGYIPPYAVVVGNPAKIIKYRFSKNIIDKLQEIKWWYWSENEIKNNLSFMKEPRQFIARFYHCRLNKKIENEVTVKLQHFKSLGYKIYYFILDFELIYSIWERIIEEYLRKYSSLDKVILLLELPEKYNAKLSCLQEKIFNKGENAPLVLTHQGNGEIANDVLQNIDCFITNREDISSQCIDYSVNYNFDIISGLEKNLFSINMITTNNKLEFSMDLNKKMVLNINKNIQKMEKDIEELFFKKRYEESLSKIYNIALMLYNYNQKYTDDNLEKQLQKIEKELSNIFFNKISYKSIEKKIVFYDGFGLDVRGLAQIYLLALGTAGYKILYITVNNGKNNIPTLEKILHSYNAKILYLPNENKINLYRIICKYIYCFKPQIGFLYTTPYDVSGVMSFMHFAGLMKRYIINLTDHTFWLGKNSFDYCLEFRDYGASVSFKYRKILTNKLIKQPYYPNIDKMCKFNGFPFKKEKKDFVVFSGGFLYKTIDENNTYYKIIDYCLKVFPNTKFWYAGYGDDSQLKILAEKYPDRVFHTGERKDLFQVLQHIDMYINTYPFLGGLMTQYSAVAGKVPITLGNGKSLEGLLFNANELEIEFTELEKIKEAIKNYISDENYRYKKECQMKNTVIDSKIFTENLIQIMEYNKSKFPVHIYDIDTTRDRKIYCERFLKDFGSNFLGE